MASIGKIAGIGALAVVAFAGTVLGKWYHTAAREEIHPERGVYGMDGLEIWIDINARMPAAAREWGCNRLRAREKAVLGANTLPPYSCQPGFGEMQAVSAYDSTVAANLGQATAGLDATRAAAVKTCFDTRISAAVTAEEIQAMNDFDQAVMSKIVQAVSKTARACKDEVAG